MRVLETQSLTQEERLTLLRCLAEHYCGLLGDDPLRPRIDALFSAYKAAAQQSLQTKIAAGNRRQFFL